MANISDDNIRQMAKLSGIALVDGDIQNFKQDITNILNYVEQLSELDTDGVKPTYHVTQLSNQWRDDDIDGGVVDASTLLDSAPGGVQNNQIKVPKVL